MNKLIVNSDIVTGYVKRDLYGSFSEHLGKCIYEGVYVGLDSDIPNVNGIRTDVVEMLKEINIPLLRWPGGCFADEYFWKDGIGAIEDRRPVYNANWGGVVESNHFGTHEFFELCEQVGCDAYVNLNVGSGSIKDMMEWIEYMTMPGSSPMADLRRANGRDKPFNVKYLGIGNENWGCGGNMCPEFYSNLYNQYSTFARQYGEKMPYKVAGGANVDDYHWTDVLMKMSRNHFDGLSIHNYTFPGCWEDKGDATKFEQDKWYSTLKHAYHFDELVRIHSAVMDRYDPNKTKGLIIDEWGTWYDVTEGTNPGFLEQESTMRDAIVAAIHFNMFHRYTDRIEMCTIAQTVNVLQSMVMTDGARTKKTPTYYAFELYAKHLENDVVSHHLVSDTMHVEDKDINLVDGTVTKSKDGQLIISLSNLDIDNPSQVEIDIRGSKFTTVKGRYLTSEYYNQINTFEEEAIKTADFTDYEVVEDKIIVTLPKHSIVTLEVN